jgi:hypothetical protein
LDDFAAFLQSRPAAEEIRRWASGFPEGISPGERALLADAVLLFGDFHELPEADRAALLQPVLSMVRGMRWHLARREPGNRELRLHTLAEVNQYCFFVAGVVGEALTGLARLHVPGFGAGEQAVVDAFHFGLFLQKVNLLKDQAGDEREGRFLVPSRAEVRGSMAVDAARALEYLLAIPQEAIGYRVFCAWSLFLGLASLPFFEAAWRERNHAGTGKISREQTQALLKAVEEASASNSALRELFAQAIALGAIEASPLGPASLEQPGRLPAGEPLGAALERLLAAQSLYSGRLGKKELLQLGL